MSTFVKLILSDEPLRRLSLFNFPSEIHEGNPQPHNAFGQVTHFCINSIYIHSVTSIGGGGHRDGRGFCPPLQGVASFPTATREAV